MKDIVARTLEDKKLRTEEEMKQGLKQWVYDYIKLRKAANLKGAKQMKQHIDKVIREKKLARDIVYKYFGDPDKPGFKLPTKASYSKGNVTMKKIIAALESKNLSKLADRVKKLMRNFLKAEMVIDKFIKVNKDLVGKKVFIKHYKYPEIKDTIRKVYKMPSINVKQICFKNSNPILIRKGDKFSIKVLGSIITEVTKELQKTASGRFIIKQNGKIIGHTLGKPYLMKAAIFLDKKDAKSTIEIKPKKNVPGNYKFTMKQNGAKVVNATMDTLRDATTYVIRLKVDGREDPTRVIVKDKSKTIADVTLENFKAVARYLNMLSLQLKWDNKEVKGE